MLSTVTPRQIHDNLVEQCDIARELHQLLEQESFTLGGNALPDLETILAAKQDLTNRFEEVSRAFLAAVRQYSTDEKNGIALFLQHLDPQGTWSLESLWQQAKKWLFQCRQQNSTNGKIISISHRQVQQAVVILVNPHFHLVGPI